MPLIGFLLGFYLFILLAAFFLLWRNRRTLELRLDVLQRASTAAQRDIERGQEWYWRYEAMNQVSYDQILWNLKPFRPEYYWKDLSFLDPEAEDRG